MSESGPVISTGGACSQRTHPTSHLSRMVSTTAAQPPERDQESAATVKTAPPAEDRPAAGCGGATSGRGAVVGGAEESGGRVVEILCGHGRASHRGHGRRNRCRCPRTGVRG